MDEKEAEHKVVVQQYSLFEQPKGDEYPDEMEKEKMIEENKLQKAVIGIKKKYGKNAVLKGMNLEEGATMKERNGQIGGHRE